MIYTKEEAELEYPHVNFLGDNIIIGDDVDIGHNVTVGDNVTIDDGVNIWPNTTIQDNTEIGRHATIMDDVIVGSGAVIASNASLPFGSVIPHKCINVKRALVINGIGEHKQLTAVDCDDGLIIGIGCMNSCKGLPITDAKKEIAKKYPDENHLYYSVLRLAQEWYDNENEKGVETELKDPELDAPSLEGSGVYNLNLFKSVKIAANAYMVRVPGGWILNQYQESVTNTWAMTSCFIPYTKP